MVFFTPRHSHFILQKNSSILADAPFNLLKSLLICVILLMWGVGSVQAATKTWVPTAGGIWTTAGNWSPNGAPATGDDVIINSNQSANITNVPTITLNSLTISGNCSLAAPANGNTLTISTTFSVSTGITLILGPIATTRLNFTLLSTATGTINGIVNMDPGTGSVFTFTNNGILIMAPAGIINGTVGFTLASGATIQIGSTAGITTDGSAGNIQVTGTISYSTGANYVYNGTAAQSTGTGLPTALTSSLTINNPGNTVTLSNAESVANGGSINLVAGVFAAGTNLTMSAATSTINRSGGSMSGNIKGGNASTYNVIYTGNSYNTGTELSGTGLNNITVTLTSGQTLTLDQNRTPDGNISINTGSTFDLNTFTINRTIANGTLTVAGTLLLGGTTGGQGNSNFPTNFTTFTMTGGTVSYDNSTGGQTVYSVPSYNNLTMGNTSGTQTAGGNTTAVTLNNNTNAADILNMVTYILAVTTPNNTGTIRTQNTTATPISTGKTWGGIVTYDAATGAQTVVNGTYSTLTMGNTSGTQTAGGNITTAILNNNTNAADILNMGTNTLTVITPNNTGTIRTQNTSATPIPSGLTWGGTVTYDAATGVQTIVTGTYSTLTLGNTSGTQTAGGNIIATTLNNNTNAADILNMGTNTLTVTTPNNTGTIRTQNTTATPLTTGKTWGGTVVFDAAAGQTIPVSSTFNNLVLSGSGAKTIATGTSVSGNLSISGATASINNGITVNASSLTLGGLNTVNGNWGSSTSSATYKNDTYFAATSGMVNVGTDTRSLTPSFTGLTSSQSLCNGTTTVTLSGTVSAAGPVYPANGETVFITINGGTTQPTTISGGVGGFSLNYTLTSVPVGANTITYSYAGDGFLKAAPNNTGTTLTLNPLTSISSQSTVAQTQCVGGSFTPITVTATGASVTYQWYSNTTASTTGGTSLGSTNGAQTNSYTPQATTAGTLYYYCIVTGTCSTVTSAASGAFLVNPATAISSQSTNAQTQCVGGSFTPITVTATGTGTLTYQWYSNATATTTGGSSLVATNGAQTNSYTPQSTTAGTLYYYCIVTGTCATATSTASGAFLVNPILPVSISVAASANPVCVGTSVTFTATPTNGGTIPSFQWKVNGTNAGTNSSTYLYTPANNDLVTCVLTSNASPCAAGTPATSNTVTITVTPYPSAPTTTGANICIGTVAGTTLSASGAVSGQKYNWYSAATGGSPLYTSTDNTVNTYTTPVLGATTSYWVTILNATGCESPRTQVTATFPSVCTDTQTPGVGSWIGYVYSGRDTNFANNIYYGHYTESETFNESFGNGNDNYCFGITSNSNALSINTVNFAVRYLMTSSRKGLYAIDLGSDDGSRLTVDGTLLYNNWNDQSFTTRASVLMSLSGSSSLIYDYYENGGGNQVIFQNITQILGNTLSTNTTQTINTGSAGAAISGDTYSTLPTGITLSGTGYQWVYSTTSGGTTTNITGATGATFTPNTSTAPFNTPGIYYVYRNAVLSSTNNISPNPYVATNTSNAATITIIGIPIITASVSTLTGFTYVSGSGPSTEQSFTVSGIYLTTNITITPPANFEISTGTGASFVPSSLITLNVVNSTVATTTIHVRMIAGLTQTPLDLPENIVLTSTGATTQNVACSGSVIVAPVITTSTSTLSGFNYNFGAGPSASQFFNVSGSNLTGNITITPPANYEISLASGSGYTSSITLTQSGGNVPLTPIYVRLITALVVNTYSGNVVLTSSFAVTQNVFCSGSVTAPIVSVSTFNLAGFIYTLGSGPSASQFVSVSGTNLTTTITITAPANFEICTTSGGTYSSTITLTPTSGSVPATKIYVRLITGLAVASYGPVNLTASSTGSIAQNVICSGNVVNTATILSSVATLNGFMYLFGTGPSSPQIFTVSGASLTADITLTPPANYEISTSGVTYTTGALTITKPSGNTLNPTLIYIRLITGLPINTYSGNLVLTSGTATAVTIPCSGQVLAVPSITAGASPGASVCIGNTVTLSSTSAGGVTNLYWTSPNGYYSQASNPPVPITGGTVSATDAGTYTVTGSVLSGVNILSNGGFESGNVGFGSSYGYVVPSTGALMPEGVYTIIGDGTFTTPNSVHDNDGGYDNCGYHTGTHSMVINGASVAGVIVWSESVSVVKNADYQFSYFLQSVNPSNPSQLQLYVNGAPAGTLNTASTTTCQWNQYYYNTNAGTNNVLQLTLINQNTAAGGNDFALDDMVFQQVFQVQSSVNLAVNPVLTPGLVVTASSNPVYTNTPVTFTATPTNGGITPTYQWSVGGVSVAGATSSTYNSTPTNGQIVSCVMTSSLPCTTTPTATSSVTMTVNSRTNYWMGANGTDWGTPTNWTAGSIPAPGNDVEYATASNGAGTPAVNNLQLDQDRTIGNLINATTKSLIIPAGKGLIVNQMITTNNDPGLIYIKSAPLSKNGSLTYHNPAGNPVFGSVEMYSMASYNPAGPLNGKYQWQYFGIPLSSVVANPTFYQSYVRSWDETGNSISTHWVSLINSSTLLPFYGYEITQQFPVTIVFRGQLVNSDFNSGPISVTSTALYPGQHIYANPYTAAINITQLNFGSDTEATVYLYNTGTFEDWVPLGVSTPGTFPGQYTAVTKSTAGSLGLPSQIPSMQGFLVKAMTPATTPNCTFGFSYNSVVINNTDPQRVQGMTDVTTDTRVSTLINLRGTNYEDRMWLFTQPGCTRTFDNGWDGRKMTGNVLTPQIYAIEPDGNYQVDAVDDINNTILGFQAGEDTEYTMTFTHTITTKYSGIFLLDLVENKTVEITQSGSTYSFVSGLTPVPVNRFMIATRNIEKDAPDANTQLKVFSSGHVVFVQNLSTLNGEMIVYDIMGRQLKRSKFGPSGTTAIQLSAIPGAYVVNASTSNERVSKRVILGD